jgi:hypothetical protein
MRSRSRLGLPAGERGIVWVAMDDTVPHSYVGESCRRAGEPVRELRWRQAQDGRRTLGRVAALGVIRIERKYLNVAGSPVAPTYGRSNPTLTRVALALQLADHLKKRLAA